MEAICKTWEKFLAVEEQMSFLNRGKDGLSTGSVEEEGEVC